MKPVVRSLLETDLYKFTMWQALLHGHPGATGEYEFKCRNEPAYPLAELKAEVERELDHLCTLMFSDEEVAYLRGLRFIKSDFADFLTVFRFQRKFITVEADGPHLRIRAAGPVVHVMGFEIYVLYIVNELYFRRFDQQAACRSGPWRTSTCRPSSRSGCACATSRRRRWRTGCRNTAATWARRSPTWSGWTPSCATSTCTSPPLNIVMKLVRCNGQAVAKLADTPGKSQCTDVTFLAYLRQVFDHPG